MEISLQNNKGFEWKKYNDLYIKGFIDKENKTDRLNDILENETLFESFLSKNNQFFSIVYETDKYVYAAVDHLRMYPLYYSLKGEHAYLSDNANWIREQIQDNEINNLSLAEFAMTGYVTGKETLYSDIKQLQAGEYLVYNRETRLLETKEYFNFKESNILAANKQDLLHQLDKIHQLVFKRLVRSLDNRTAVLPLSGGYDSRIIAMMLKQLGYEKVICFTYGKPGNWEANVSKEIAKDLGYQWIFIPYNKEKWRKWFQSKERKEYFNLADGLTSLAHIQDHLAVGELKAKNLIPKDSVIIPGHTAFLSFSSYDQDSKDIQDIIKLLFEKHYSLWGGSYREKSHFKKQLIEKMYNLLNTNYIRGQALENLFYQWELRERHAKFICNSVRAYEQFGYEWRLPLWEKEMVRFYLDTPQKYRADKQLYKNYFNQYFVTSESITQPNSNVKRQNKSLIKNIIKRNFLVYNTLLKIKLLGNYNKHPLDWYKIISYSKYARGTLKGANSINSFLIKIQLNTIKQRG